MDRHWRNDPDDRGNWNDDRYREYYRGDYYNSNYGSPYGYRDEMQNRYYPGDAAMQEQRNRDIHGITVGSYDVNRHRDIHNIYGSHNFRDNWNAWSRGEHDNYYSPYPYQEQYDDRYGQRMREMYENDIASYGYTTNYDRDRSLYKPEHSRHHRMSGREYARQHRDDFYSGY